MNPYDHKKIEQKWQKIWAEQNIYKTEESSTKPKQYVLDMFPYPSGEGLHVGHPRGYIATDVYSRMKRMSGFNVLHPMGWDAFGLPAENYAIKNKVHPRVAVEKNIVRFKEQLSILGPDYDWSREINTTDPEYYRWTQWIFLQMYKKGLAYESYEPINWCPGCQTGLANEDVESDGTCERCGSVVEKKPMRQWVLKITDYADRMLADLDKLPKWPTGVKEAQRHWIGRTEGSEIDFPVAGQDYPIKVFTTRADTLFGATFIAVSAGLAKKWMAMGWNSTDEVKNYIETTIQAEAVKDFKEKEKTGIFAGFNAINPANQEEIPVWITNYVLSDVGTGAIMAVPAHDERDFEFAKKYDLLIKQVVKTLNSRFFFLKDSLQEGYEEKFLSEGCKLMDHKDWGLIVYTNKTKETVLLSQQLLKEGSWYFDVSGGESLIGFKDKIFDIRNGEHSAAYEFGMTLKIPKEQLDWDQYSVPEAFIEEGSLINSSEFNGLTSSEAKQKITEFVGGKMVTNYKLKDWVFSRQRYWGEPIPMIHCEKCGVVPVPEDQLPVVLPEVSHYEPTGNGESPLAAITDWVNVTCPTCGGPAKRETNTMPQWAGSSWYYLRYIDPNNSEALIDPTKEKNTMPVDVYVGGDHATRHLIYARFWHKFLFDIGAVSTEEPFPRLEFLGYILAEDGRKMSKRWGNVVNPDDMVDRFGADAFRLYEMFIGPFESTAPWNMNGMVGTLRFVERIWRFNETITFAETPDALVRSLHKTIKKVSEDIEAFKFNTAVSAMMVFANDLESAKQISKDDWKKFLQVLAPFAPHIVDELWSSLGEKQSIHLSSWPAYNPSKVVDDTTTIGIQINGKVRAEITLANDATESDVRTAVMKLPEMVKWIGDQPVKKFIYIPGKIISVVM